MQKLKSALEADARIILCLCAALLITMLWVATCWQLSKSLDGELDSTRSDVISLSLLFKEHATRTVESTDQAVVYLRHRYNVAGMALNLAQDLKEGLAPDDIYNLFSIVDDKANVVLSTQAFQPLNLADREHINVHMRSSTVGLYISKPVLGRVSGKWSLQMTRRIDYPDGSFKGVVVASMNPQYFTSLYQKINLGNFGSISLIGEDGVIRVRHVGQDDSMGQNITSTELFKAIHANGNGVLRSTSQIDHRERLYAYQKLDKYPLFVAVGIDLEERLASYQATKTQTLVLSGLATLLILLGTAALVILIGHLMESRREAVLARKAKLHFLSNMSHEFRTPLNGILGYSETLMEDFSGTRQGEFAAAIHSSGMRLLGLVDSVLELSALRSGKVHLAISEERLEDIIIHAVSLHQEAAEKKGLTLTATLAPGLPTHILCDRAHLMQLLEKLINNAVRFTVTGGVCLNVDTMNGSLLFSVIDTGCGIPPALQETIFEKFAQIDDSASRPHDGAGLGLTIANSLAELMDGSISVQSTPDTGSTFRFILPIRPAH